MNSSESLKELAAAVTAAQAEFKAVGKSGENKFDRYSYANLEDYVRVVRPVLSDHGLSVVSSVDEVVALDDRTTKNGGLEHAVRVKLTVRVLHTSGEWVEAHAWGEGQDRADKAVYKAITGARKYALASVLGLATTDDPEADEQVGNAPAPHQRQQPRQQQKPNGNGKTPNADEQFSIHIGECFEARDFTKDDAKCATDAVLKAKGVNRIAQLSDDDRQKFVDAILTGKMDKYKLESLTGAGAK